MNGDTSGEKALAFSSLLLLLKEKGSFGGPLSSLLHLFYVLSEKQSCIEWQTPRLVAGKIVNATEQALFLDGDLGYHRNIESQNSVQATFLPQRQVLRNILFAFQSIDSEHVRWVNGRYMLSNIGNQPWGNLVVKILDLATDFRLLKNLITAIKLRTDAGLFMQGVCSVVEEEISLYCKMLSQLEKQLASDRQDLTAHGIYVWMQVPHHRIRFLLVILESIKSLSGGPLLTQLYSTLNHADVVAHSISVRLLQSACRPFCEMITNWIREGFMFDRFDEFFIKKNKQSIDQMWYEMYSLAEDNIPHFMSLYLGTKVSVYLLSILMILGSINRKICQFDTYFCRPYI